MRYLVFAWVAFFTTGVVTKADAAWIVRTVNTNGTNGGAGDITTIDQAEGYLASLPTAGTDSPNVINYGTFPTGTNADFFALEATGYVTGLAAPTAFTFNVSSDDGFRVRINGVVPTAPGGQGDNSGLFQFSGPTGNSNTNSSPFILNNGDFIDLTMYERDGGQFVTFSVVGGGLVGDIANGFTISDVNPVPETSHVLAGALALLAGAAFMRRRSGAVPA